ncbi:MAG: hypothetical protein HQK55_05240 [Deltaproteobacteria bacterium]|nr:hypothetical protein [Deltaproteobacteria bacterium]
MKITGEQIDEGVKAWIVDELKNGPAKEYDIGKFFFTVGSGTIGFLFVALKLNNPSPNWTVSLTVSFIALIIATLVSLVMVIPKKWSINEETDLHEKRAAIIKWTIREIYIWFIV